MHTACSFQVILYLGFTANHQDVECNEGLKFALTHSTQNVHLEVLSNTKLDKQWKMLDRHDLTIRKKC